VFETYRPVWLFLARNICLPPPSSFATGLLTTLTRQGTQTTLPPPALTCPLCGLSLSMLRTSFQRMCRLASSPHPLVHIVLDSFWFFASATHVCASPVSAHAIFVFLIPLVAQRVNASVVPCHGFRNRNLTDAGTPLVKRPVCCQSPLAHPLSSTVSPQMSVLLCLLSPVFPFPPHPFRTATMLITARAPRRLFLFSSSDVIYLLWMRSTLCAISLGYGFASLVCPPYFLASIYVSSYARPNYLFFHPYSVRQIEARYTLFFFRPNFAPLLFSKPSGSSPRVKRAAFLVGYLQAD